MKARLKIYGILVNRIPEIRKHYMRVRNKVSGAGKIYAWCYLFKLNVAYYVLRKRHFEVKSEEEAYYYEYKRIPSRNSESELSLRETPKLLAKRLAAYDVISFDIFDTLILRPFSKPSDLFFLVGDALGYPDFVRIREEMEARAREASYKLEKHREVSLSEIYELMEQCAGVPKEIGMQSEYQVESRLCFANPYMLEVIKHLRAAGKRVIAVSDMYLSAEQIKNLLDKNGYDLIKEVFVSCEYKVSKSTGELYDVVKKGCGAKLSYIHVGDNLFSDVVQAREHGFDAEYYKNVNEAGAPYRPEDMSVITGSIYRGLVNSHIHNGLDAFSMEYECGFIYGGILVLGYCYFIHNYVCQNRIDKILFLARDGDVLRKAYDCLYPGENREYVYWSRIAATKMSAKYFKYDYLRRFLYHKVNQDYSILEIFSAMELEEMLEQAPFGQKVKLTDKNVREVEAYIKDNWTVVLHHYEEQVEAGRAYYKQVLKGCKKVCAVDIGWAGSGAIALRHMVKDVWNIPCDVVGIIAGTNTCHNAEPDASESLLQSGKLISYLFSQGHNRDIWRQHNLNKGHNIYMELLLSSPTAGFKGFSMKEKRVKLLFRSEGEAEEKKEARQIQTGIMKFIHLYQQHITTYGYKISINGIDAYHPFSIAAANSSAYWKSFASVRNIKNCNI